MLLTNHVHYCSAVYIMCQDMPFSYRNVEEAAKLCAWRICLADIDLLKILVRIPHYKSAIIHHTIHMDEVFKSLPHKAEEIRMNFRACCQVASGKMPPWLDPKNAFWQQILFMDMITAFCSVQHFVCFFFIYLNNYWETHKMNICEHILKQLHWKGIPQPQKSIVSSSGAQGTSWLYCTLIDSLSIFPSLIGND